MRDGPGAAWPPVRRWWSGKRQAGPPAAARCRNAAAAVVGSSGDQWCPFAGAAWVPAFAAAQHDDTPPTRVNVAVGAGMLTRGHTCVLLPSPQPEALGGSGGGVRVPWVWTTRRCVPPRHTAPPCLAGGGAAVDDPHSSPAQGPPKCAAARVHTWGTQRRRMHAASQPCAPTALPQPQWGAAPADGGGGSPVPRGSRWSQDGSRERCCVCGGDGWEGAGKGREEGKWY